ncbi:hypothetical protein CRG98_033183 [Punica granatum]|uniref:Uncharacterized protein n=1 Tax=Punica granatum TaxID=22663 RepID=A0A2I0IQZ8_PUNGR|nr:hypothetical protein CRG98_033183 [Punica granatum]
MQVGLVGLKKKKQRSIWLEIRPKGLRRLKMVAVDLICGPHTAWSRLGWLAMGPTRFGEMRIKCPDMLSDLCVFYVLSKQALIVHQVHAFGPILDMFRAVRTQMSTIIEARMRAFGSRDLGVSTFPGMRDGHA